MVSFPSHDDSNVPGVLRHCRRFSGDSERPFGGRLLSVRLRTCLDGRQSRSVCGHPCDAAADATPEPIESRVRIESHFSQLISCDESPLFGAPSQFDPDRSSPYIRVCPVGDATSKYKSHSLARRPVLGRRRWRFCVRRRFGFVFERCLSVSRAMSSVTLFTNGGMPLSVDG